MILLCQFLSDRVIKSLFVLEYKAMIAISEMKRKQTKDTSIIETLFLKFASTLRNQKL